MFARNAERLIILGDLGTGYLNRLHSLLSFKRPPVLFTTELDKFTKNLFTRKFPELPSDLPKQSGFDAFRRNADAVRASLVDYALTLADCLTWLDAAWVSLQTLASPADVLFDLSVNSEVTHYFFTLVTRFVQVHLLIAQLDTPQHNLCGYYYALYVLKANPSALSSQSNAAVTVPPSELDADYLRLATYLNATGRAPLRQLQGDFTTISVTIGNALCSPSFSNPVYAYSKLKSYSEHKLFTLDASHSLLHPATDVRYADLLNVDRIRQYIVYGFLVCPGELSRPGALELLKVALLNDLIIPLHRDVALNVQKEYGELFDGYSKGKFTLKKHKKTLKEATGDQSSTLLFHAELRILLQQQASVLLPVYQDNPHVLAPKLQQVLALMHACKEEVVWYIRHLGFHVLFSKSVKEREKALFDDHLSPLVHTITELTALIDRHRDAIQSYYLAHMQGLDLDLLLAALQPVASLPGLDQTLRALFDSICNSIGDRAITDNFESVRLNWQALAHTRTHSHNTVAHQLHSLTLPSYRCFCSIRYRASTGMSSAKAGGVGAAAAAKISAAMNALVAHSRHVDCLDTELRAHGSFALLYWYKEEVQTCFRQALNGKDGQHAYALSYVKTPASPPSTTCTACAPKSCPPSVATWCRWPMCSSAS